MVRISEKSKPSSPSVLDIAKRISRHENAVLAMILIGLIAIFAVMSGGKTVTRANGLNILLQSSMRGLAAIAETFVILSGGIDVSIGGVGLFCSMLGSSLMTLEPTLRIASQSYSMYVAIPIMLLAGACWGIINGSAVTRLGMPPLISTLAMWQISTGAAFQIKGGQSITGLPTSLTSIGEGTIANIPVISVIFIAVAVVAYFTLKHTTFGISTYAVGGNEVAARLCGIKVQNVRLILYVVSGFLGGLAAVLMTARLMSSSMQTLAGLEIDSITAVLVGGISLEGGKGTLIGGIIGAMIIGVVNNAMNVLYVPLTVQTVIRGTILITAVAIDNRRRR